MNISDREVLDKKRHRPLARRLAVYFAAGLGLGLVGLLAIAGYIAILVSRGPIESATLDHQVRLAISQLLGPGAVVKLDKSRISLTKGWRASLVAHNVQAFTARQGHPAITIGTITAAIPLWSFASGKFSADAIELTGMVVHAGGFRAAFTGAETSLEGANSIEEALQRLDPDGNIAAVDIRHGLEVMAGAIGSLDTGMGENGIEQITVTDLSFVTDGPAMVGSRFSIPRADIARNSAGGVLTATAKLRTADHVVAISLKIDPPGENGQVIHINIPELSSTALADISGLHSLADRFHGTISAGVQIPIQRSGLNGQPIVSVTTKGIDLNFGRGVTMKIDRAELTLRVMPEREQIQLERSRIAIGNSTAVVFGSARLADTDGDDDGMVFELEAGAAPMLIAPSDSFEPPQPATVRFRGTFDMASNILTAEQFVVDTPSGSLTGSGGIGFSDVAPSVVLAFKSGGMSVSTFKQLWPIFLVPRPRKWVHANLAGGHITAMEFQARIPKGIIGTPNQHLDLQPEHIAGRISFKDARFDTFGKLPPIRDAIGVVEVNGAQAEVRIDAGAIHLGERPSVAIDAASMLITGVMTSKVMAQVHISGHGQAASIAMIAASDPLDALAILDAQPADFSGLVKAKVALDFPLAGKLARDNVNWNVLLETDGIDAARPIFGHAIKEVDARIDITQERVKLKGRAKVDDVLTDLDIVKPTGSGESGRHMILITAVLDEEARKRVGLNLDPVITGQIRVVTEDDGSGGPRHLSVDLTDATLSLPWIGWSKGAGIKAQAKLRMQSQGSTVTLSAIEISGTGFSAKGQMRLNDDGLVRARFNNVLLNQGDQFSVAVDRIGNGVSIQAGGRQIDARSLIKQLLEGEMLGQDEHSDVRLQATFAKALGFNGRSLADVNLRFNSSNGQTQLLDFNGRIGNGALVTADIRGADTLQRFTINAGDAGSLLAFADLYERMVGGQMSANLGRRADNAYIGPIKFSDFAIEREKRLEKLISVDIGGLADRPQNRQRQAGKPSIQYVGIDLASANIEKTGDYLRVADGIVRGGDFGSTFAGYVYDGTDNMNLTGTFMPAFGISRAVSAIPLVGEILSNGRDQGLIGINYRLAGPANQPTISVNPVSLVAPGIFNQVFAFPQ